MNISITKIFHNFVTLLSSTVLIVQPVFAQNITSAAGGPQVLNSASGIDMVMINTADANGVSHNIYTGFNVGANGLILNNANTEFVMTDLAGWVQGNSNLIAGSAQIIINEVIGGSESHLDGFIEVAGNRADVIVANAYGITCNGCGFINTDRAVLTTGTTTFDNGNFTGFSVEQGGITIGENGANALDTTRFDLISRRLSVAGAIAGHRLRVITGRNDVTYVTSEVTEKAPDGSPSPGLAIDSTVLGGMYGDSITILSTEDGVGVRAPENMAANAGEMVLTADGRLVMRHASAVGNITATSSDDIVLEDTVIATGDVTMTAAQDIDLEADVTLVSQSALILDAGHNAGFGANAQIRAATGLEIGAGQDVTLGDAVSLISYGTLDLSGNNLNSQGQSLLVSGAQDSDGNTAIANLNLGFQNRIDLGAAIVASSGALSVESRILDIAADAALPATQFVSALDTDIVAQDISATDAVVYAGGTLDIGKTAQDLTLQGGTFSAEGAVAIAGQTVALDATVLSRSATLDLGADTLSQAGYLGAATTLDVASTGPTMVSGTLLAGTAISLDTGGELDITGLVQATTALDITAGGIDNSGTVLASAGDVILTSQGGLDVSGTLYSAGTLELSVVGDTSIAGQIAAIGTLDLQGGGMLALGGQLSSDAAITINGISGLNIGAAGLIFGGGALDIAAQFLDNAGVIASATGSVTVATGAGLINSGTLSATQNLVLTSASSLNNSGRFLANGDITLGVAQALTNDGVIEAGGTLGATAASLDNTASMASLGDTLALDISGDVTNAGTLQADQALSLTAGGTLANNGALISFGSMDLDGQTTTALSALTNAAGGVIMSRQAMHLATGTLANAGNIGTLDGAITFSNLDTFDNSGTLSAAGDLAITPTTTLLNTGTLLSQGTLTLIAPQDFTNQGTIQALDTVSVTGTNIYNTGEIQALNGTLAISASGDITNDGFLFGGFANRLLTDGNVVNTATIGATGLVEITGRSAPRAASLSNAATARITSGFDVSLQAADIANYGEIAADNGVATLAATTGLIHDGSLSAGLGISLGADTDVDFNGDVLSGGTLQITSTGTVTNNANLQAEGNFVLGAAGLVNNDRIKSLSGGLDIASAGDVTNNATLFGGAALQIRTDGTLVLNSDDLTSGDILQLAGLTGDAMAALEVANGQELVATGNSVIVADTITNAGAIASATGNLTVIGANGLTNAQTGLLYAGASLSVLSDGVILNDAGVLLASQNISIGGSQSPRAMQFTNRNGGLVETFNGDISIYADTIENLREVTVTTNDPPATENTFIVDEYHQPVWSNGWVIYQTDHEDQYSETVQTLGNAAQIISANDIYMQGDTVTNAYSLISATNNIIFDVTTVNNVGRDSFTRTDSWSEGRTENYDAFSTWTTNIWADAAPVSTFSNVTHTFGTIEAGGTIAGTISGTITNGAVQAGLAPGIVSTPAPTLPDIAPGASDTVPSGLAVSPGVTAPLAAGLMQAVTPDNSTLPGTGSTPGTVDATDAGLVAGPDIGALNQPALFVTNTDPDADFLIETRFEFVDLDSFLSSDYFIAQIDFDPSITQKRLGDAYVETDYIRQQIFDLTGQRLLTPGVSEYDQMKAMYDGAIDAAQSLGLRPGIALTPEQIAALTTDIIWLEEQIVRGQKVLVPKVYLARATLDANRNAAQMVARDINLEVGSFTNYGTVAGDNIYIDASENILNIGGTISANDALALMAANTIRNTDGVITGKDVYLSAFDIINETTATRLDFGNNHFDVVDATALITATNDLTMIAANDITVTGADLVAGHTGYIQAGGNITFAALELTSETNFGWKNEGGFLGIGAGSGSVHTESTTHQVSSVSAGAGLTIISTGEAATDGQSADILFEGTQVSAGGDLQIAALQGNVILGAVQDTRYSDSQTSGSGLLSTYTSRTQTFDLGNRVTSLEADNIDIYAAGSLVAEGTTFNTGHPASREGAGDTGLPSGNLTLTAAYGDIILGSVTDVHASSEQSSGEILWGLIGNSNDKRTLTTTTTGITADVAGNMALVAGRDLTVTAADIQAEGRFNTRVGGETRLLAAVDTGYTSSNTMTNNGIIITTTAQTDLTQSATFNSIRAASVSFDPDSKVTFDAGRDAVIDSAHPAVWVGNADGTDRLAIAGAYLGWENTGGGSDQIDSPGGEDAPHWRSAGDWEDDQLLLASLPTAADGPGYGYVDDLLARDGTVNNTITLLDDHFYDQNKELNPAFKALVSLAIGAVMPAASLGTFGTAAASSFTTDLVAGALTGNFDLGQALGSALFAGASAFATDAFDLGKIAGASQDSLIGAPILAAGTPALLSPAALLDGVGDAFVTASLTTAVYGGDFGANLRGGLGSFALNQTLGGVQFGIGELGNGFDGQWEGSPGHVLLHGLAGCAFAAASGGDCAAGAVGGVSQSLYAGYLGRNGLVGQEHTQTAALIGGLAGYFASGSNGANVGLASTTARSGLQNNYLSHTEWAKYTSARDACGDDDACLAEVDKWAEAASFDNEHRLLVCHQAGNCAEIYQEIADAEVFRSQFHSGSEIVGRLQEQAYIASRNPNVSYSTRDTGLTGETVNYSTFNKNYCAGLSNGDCVRAFEMTVDIRRTGDRQTQLGALGTVATLATLAVSGCGGGVGCYALLAANGAMSADQLETGLDNISAVGVGEQTNYIQALMASGLSQGQAQAVEFWTGMGLGAVDLATLAVSAPKVAGILTRGGGKTPSAIAEEFGQLTGNGQALAGHGELQLLPDGTIPTTVVPDGTYVTVPIGEGYPLIDSAGQLIESGDVIGGMVRQRRYYLRTQGVDTTEGAITYLPGSQMPDYTLLPSTYPGYGIINVLPRSRTVTTPSTLSDILQQNMGCVNWAACTVIKQ